MLYCDILQDENIMRVERISAMERDGADIFPDPEFLLRLSKTRMPFGKYKDRLLIDLPEAYVFWFSNQGFSKGQLGEMLREVYEIKVNGLKYLFDGLANRCFKPDSIIPRD
jgi:uncharacterized protein (DUF3820 family)